MAALDSLAQLNSLLEEWTQNQSSSSFSVTNSLHRMAELLEKETEEYYKMDPDPFDDRHPGRAVPTCALGHLMKTLFKNEDFMSKLISTYLISSNRDQTDLHIAASRLLLDVMPGLETTTVFQETDGLVRRLFHWAEVCEDPLRSYATGLLAGAMELNDVADKFKDSNSHLVPMLLTRLHKLKCDYEKENEENTAVDDNQRHFGVFAKETERSPEKKISSESSQESGAENSQETSSPVKGSSKGDNSGKNDRRESMKRALSPSYYSDDLYRFKKKSRIRDDSITEYSNSSWAEMKCYVIGTYSLQPLSTAMKQRVILQYLRPMAEYQELIGAAFEHNAMDLVFFYMDLRKNSDIRLAFEALRYTANLLCHKKFAIEFLTMQGVQRTLQVPRPSVAACGVSLCIYYLSYFEDAMERVCQLPDETLAELVSYTLWLLECSHDSSRCHAAMFFGQAFPYRVILNLFDQKDGLRRLFNVISTLQIMDVDERRDVSDDQLFTMRQLTRHASLALKKYFEAHLSHKVEEIKRSHAHSDDSGSPVHEVPAYKALKLTPEIVQENVEIMMELMPVRIHWTPEITCHKLGGIKLLCQLIALAPNWNSFTGKSEMIKNVLDVINVLVSTPRSQLALLESVPLYDNLSTPAVSVLIGLAEGEVIQDPEVQKSALSVIINCVCGPVEKLGGGLGRYIGTGSKKRINLKVGEDILSKMWNGVRINNGIMVLLKLLSIKTPITDADCIRALACKALVGLSRSETVRQIISKLPLFNNGQLQLLMKEPVLHDKQQEHIKFCKYANELLERVVGKKSSAHLDASLEEIRRADIVAQTRINFQEKELLQLIYSHLQSEGLTEAAAALQKEANLPHCATPPNVLPVQPCVFASPHFASPRISRQMSHPLASHATLTSDVPSTSSGLHSNSSSQRDSPTNSGSTPGTPGPIRFHLSRQHPQASPGLGQVRASNSKSRFSSEKDCILSSPAWRTKGHLKGQGEYDMTLDKIVTEYLRKQHALCRNPVTTCPPMSLFQPHRCPEPRGRRMAPINCTSRIYNRMLGPKVGGIGGPSVDRKFIYSRFRPCQSYRNADDGGMLCCSFSRDEQYLMYGTFWGDIKLVSLQSGEETASYNFHQVAIEDFQQARDSDLLLISYEDNGSGVWTYGDVVDNKYSFEDSHIEFSKQVQDRIIGTKDETANIYDVSTGQRILKLYDPNKANNYLKNRATFNPTDELVLNDGVLWDVRSGKSIHKFDKFNANISGVFHPMGLEIIINSEVWDIRNYHLLHTVPALNQCQIRFNNLGDVIYAIYVMDEEMDDFKVRSPYSSTFRTFDSTDYSSIATIDVKSKSILDLCTDKSDCYLAVVENLNTDLGTEEFVCKLYEVGKLRDEEDNQPEDDEDDLEDVDEDDDDDDDSHLIDFNDSNDEDFFTDDDDDDDDDDNDGNEDENDMFSQSEGYSDDDDDISDDALFELL